MGFFSLKAICSICDNEIGLNRNAIKNKGWICRECFKKCGGLRTAKPVLMMTAEEIKIAIIDRQVKTDAAIITQNVEQSELLSFIPTKKFSTFIEFDDNQKKWLIPDGLFGGKKHPKIYNYSDIVDFELLEDEESITKGGLGRALVGGVLLGGAAAVVGGVTGRKSRSICNSLKIKITINNMNNPVVYIKFLTTATKKSGFVYKSLYNSAQECLSLLQLICNSQEVVEEYNNVGITSNADEILKYKNLLDNAIITQEEFDAKKKQLLELT